MDQKTVKMEITTPSRILRIQTAQMTQTLKAPIQAVPVWAAIPHRVKAVIHQTVHLAQIVINDLIIIAFILVNLSA